MKNTLMYLFAATLLLSCSANEESDASNSTTSEDVKEKDAQKIDETFDLEIINFINDSTEESSAGKLPMEFKNFNFEKVGALHDEKRNTLSIYFANFQNPEKTYGMCCGETQEEGQRTLSFIIKHDESGEIDRKESFINFTTNESFVGLNMVDRTMNGDYEIHDNYVEGSFTYTNDLDSSAYIKTTFKLNLEKE